MDERVKKQTQNEKAVEFAEAVQKLAQKEGIVCYVVAAIRDEQDKGLHGSLVMNTQPISGNLGAHNAWGEMLLEQTTEALKHLEEVVSNLERKMQTPPSPCVTGAAQSVLH